MTKAETVMALYKTKITHLAMQYMNQYKAAYTVRDTENGGTFMTENYESYRKSVATITTQFIHENMGDSEITSALLEQNKYSIGEFAGRMFNLLATGSEE